MHPDFKIKQPQDLKNIWIYLPYNGGKEPCINKYTAELEQSIKYMRDLGCIITNIESVVQLETINCVPNLVLMCPDEYNNCDEVYVALTKLCQSIGIPLLTNRKLIKLFCESYYYVYQIACRVDSYFDVRVPFQDMPSVPAHCPVPLPKHILSPSIIANSLQCVSYSANVLHNSQQHEPTSLTNISVLFTDKHILSPKQFNRNLLRQIFRKASYYMNLAIEHKPMPRLLDGKIIGLLFYTPSTRTRCSFESAIMRLGGGTIYVGAHESSVQKGESFNDTVRTLDSYVDGLIIRTPNNIALDTYKHIARHSIINAGDQDEHPTQALLDLFTIRETRGTINNLTICIIGDCLHGRTVASLVKLLCNYTATIYFAPEPGFEPPAGLLAYLLEHGKNLTIMPIITDADAFLEMISTVDVIYVTRIQKERVNADYSQPLKWQVTPGLLSFCKPDMIILHPLPRNEELPESVDKDSRALYFKQMEYGLYLRMAIVELMFGCKL